MAPQAGDCPSGMIAQFGFWLLGIIPQTKTCPMLPVADTPVTATSVIAPAFTVPMLPVADTPVTTTVTLVIIWKASSLNALCWKAMVTADPGF